MQILLNSNNEITNYAVVGGFENGVEVKEIPTNFREMFKPKLYKYIDSHIVLNDNYIENEEQPKQKNDDIEKLNERISELENIVKELTQGTD
ncbi:DUF2977 domain-containing protein [Mammaliicoccus sciuri]|uniref:DUF2977 domain-containing protein n=1 Tax=Mammaliicoccus sciuri TaxID=1296 RepID=UPI000D1F33F0|nr:DUF2977 domain-containing protein [Mammaliicoccus sciuri]PTK27518.1 hypothetical protein BUZ86_05415 [Mammaliicoccus sciuri]